MTPIGRRGELLPANLNVHDKTLTLNLLEHQCIPYQFPSASMDSLYRILYPIPPANRTRTRRLEILCLGLSRSGTESLKQALETLGCQKVYHGFNIADNPRDAVVWCRLGFAKYRDEETSDSGLFTASSFDRVLGDCDAVTDIPCAIFGPELLKAYPHAKVILNRRTDEDAWVRSVQSALMPVVNSRSYWFRCLFDTEMFWIRRCYDACLVTVLQTGSWTNDNEGLEFGKKIYQEHYARLESIMRRDGREWLDWGVQDGWDPLCAFLGRPKPDGMDFPSGNDPKEFLERRAKVHGERHRRMKRNMWIVAGLTGLGMAIVISQVIGPFQLV